MARWLSGRGVYEDDIGVYLDLRYDAARRGYTFLAGDYYTNTRNGNVFLCQQATKIPKTGTWHRLDKWKYLRTEVIERPWTAVTGLSIARKGNAYTVKWAVPSYATDKRRNDRPSWVSVSVRYYYGGTYQYNWLYDQPKLGLSTKSITVNLKRSDYYPFTSRKIFRLNARAVLRNNIGVRDYRDAYYYFEPPRQPTIGVITQNANNGVLSAQAAERTFA